MAISTSKYNILRLEKILKEISLVDKIIFGKLNYNIQTNQFSFIKNFPAIKTPINLFREC